MADHRMTGQELKSTGLLALIFASRLMGLFMILPVLAVLAAPITGATPFLIGLTAGIYGFTQALMQFPFGVLSDYWGRKPVILLGLLLFLIGSLVAAFSATIYGLIIGRAIQGMGAIGAPVLALVADVTRSTVRTRAMAIIGISIGLTFALAFLVGPMLASRYDLPILFLITGGLSVIGMGLLASVPKVAAKTPSLPLGAQLRRIGQQAALWRLYGAVFVLHAVLTALFLILPLKIQLVFTTPWHFYAPVLISSLVLVSPLLRLADKREWQSKLSMSSFAVIGTVLFLIPQVTEGRALLVSMSLFFVAFNYLEASLPSRVSQLATQETRGAALGLFSCAQFLGMFCGGALGGLLPTVWIGGLGLSLVMAVVLSRILVGLRPIKVIR